MVVERGLKCYDNYKPPHGKSTQNKGENGFSNILFFKD